MVAYYNEIDNYAADWLENLIAAGHIAPGVVDRRSIVDVRGDDLKDYTQCHFFAGIAGWSLALRLAGWLDDKPVWTGSCPCQPFSAAGKRKGTADARHLWPEFARLIDECGPPVVFGEQVASKDGRSWLAGVRTDLEALGYAVGAADLCSAGIGAPHIRQRLWWVADAGASGRRALQRSTGEDGRAALEPDGFGNAGGVANAGTNGCDQQCGERGVERGARERRDQPDDGGAAGGVADAGSQRRDGQHALLRPEEGGRHEADLHEVAGSSASFWDAADLLPCTDGKARRVEPGTFPLAHGVPARVGRLRAYGNAINPWLAAEFIAACKECRNLRLDTFYKSN